MKTEGDDRGWDGWMASPTQWKWIWARPGSWGLVCCSQWGHQESDTTEQMNWTIFQSIIRIIKCWNWKSVMKLCCQNPSFIDIWPITDSSVVKDGKWKVPVKMSSSLEMPALQQWLQPVLESEPTAPPSEGTGPETTALSDVCDSSALLWSVFLQFGYRAKLSPTTFISLSSRCSDVGVLGPSAAAGPAGSMGALPLSSQKRCLLS